MAVFPIRAHYCCCRGRETSGLCFLLYHIGAFLFLAGRPAFSLASKGQNTPRREASFDLYDDDNGPGSELLQQDRIYYALVVTHRSAGGLRRPSESRALLAFLAIRRRCCVDMCWSGAETVGWFHCRLCIDGEAYKRSEGYDQPSFCRLHEADAPIPQIPAVGR